MNNRVHFFLISLSAVLYGSAYVCPVYLWWTVLIFLVPLYYLVLHNKIGWIDGILWSCIAFSLHLSGVLEGLFATAQGPLALRILVPLLVLLLAVAYGVIWFIITQWLMHLVGYHYRLGTCIVTTWLFFLWLEHGCIFMLGAWEGYILCNPLIPLVQYPPLLYYMPIIGPAVFLLFFIVTQVAIAACVAQRLHVMWPFFLLSMWGSGVVLWYTEKRVGYTCPPLTCGTAFFRSFDNITLNGRVVRDYSKELLHMYPETEIILFPETALRCPLVPGEPDIIALWGSDHLDKPVTFLIGGFRWDNDIYRNTVYWIHDGKVIDLFDKRHTMALTERAPSEFLLGNVPLIKKVYFEKFPGIVPHKQPRPVWNITPYLTIIPYICSELFFNNKPDHQPVDGAIIMALCNDHWLARDYMRYQMFMGARYRGIQWQIPIIYVAHFYQGLCEPDGNLVPLAVFRHNL